MLPESFPEKASQYIKQQAQAQGFDFCGISKAEFLEAEAPRLETWLKRNYQGKMHWMENHFDKRLDPTKLVPGAQSVISLMLNYYPEKPLPSPNGIKISKYAYGEDYHFVMKKKMRQMVEHMQEELGDFHARVFVDSAPVMDRAWAERAGLGWKGKHSLTLNRDSGSFFFIAEIICDLPLAYDGPMPDYCGTCTRCIDACPTDAIEAPYVVNGSKCISYLTIELKEEIPSEFQEQMEGWAFGCDICQDVCPWNRFSKPHQTEQFEPKPELEQLAAEGFEEVTEEVFCKAFKKSPVKRAKYKGFVRNLRFIQEPRS